MPSVRRGHRLIVIVALIALLGLVALIVASAL
jgi:hypothetical protein